MDNKPAISSDSFPQQSSETFADIDFEKLKSILKRSLPWLIAIVILSNLSAYLLVRWTKPVFESESQLKLEFKSEASALGINDFVENQNINHLSGEIELLKSKLFFNKVIDAADIEVSYSFRGNILDDERYKHSAFIVEFETISEPALFDKEIDIEFIGEGKFNLKFHDNGLQLVSTHEFGQPFQISGTRLTIFPTNYYTDNLGKGHFFVINSRKSLVDYFQENFDVQPLNFQANTIRVSLKDNNRYKAKELVDIADSVYLKYSQDQKTIENNQKIDWLNNELGQVGTKLEGYEDYFERFTLKNRTNNLDLVLTETIEAINLLDSQRYELVRRVEATDELIKEINKEYHSPITLQVELHPTGLINQLTDYNELVLDNQRILKSYSTETQTYKNSVQKLSQAKQLLKEGISSRLEYLKEELRGVENRKRLLENSFNNIPGQDREYKKAKLYHSLYEEQYLALMQAKTNFEVAKAGTKTDITILSAASLPTQAIAPDKLIIHGIGLVAGFVIGFVFIAIRYLLSNTITNLSELERLTGSPILGSIPRYTASKLEETRMVIEDNPRSSISEALRTIRTNIEFLSSSKSTKVISVTSTVGSEGKTFVSVNLGGVMALSNKKVVIVDLDMRKPRVHKAFGKEANGSGVSTVLIEKHKIEEVVCDTSIDNLKFIPAGPTPPNPSELLLNGSFDHLLDQLKSNYDIVILDTPPSAIVTDATLVMKKVDIPIYVFKADYSKKSFVDTLNRLIHVNKFKNISVVLNNLQHNGNKKYGYGYYTDKAI